jgi:hypothetical protein
VQEPYNPIYDQCAHCDELGDACPEHEDRAFVISLTGQALIDGATAWVTDHVKMEGEELAEGSPYGNLILLPNWLPANCARHYTPEFLARFLLAVEAVSRKLKHDPNPYLACTAEELAAHAILDEAADWADDWEDDSKGKFSIVDEPRGRADIEWLKDSAFEDYDVLFHFDARMDGIEESELADQMGFANLAPLDWFKPFRGKDGDAELHQLSSTTNQ